MSLSGSFSVPVKNCRGYVSMKVVWSATQNIGNNTSTIRATGYLVRGRYGRIYAHANKASLTIRDGSTNYVKRNNYAPVGGGNNTTSTLVSNTVTIKHKDNGTKNISISLSLEFDIHFSGVWVGTFSINSPSINLNPIPRQSNINSVSNVTYGSKIVPTINITSHSTSFNNQVTASIDFSGTKTTQTFKNLKNGGNRLALNSAMIGRIKTYLETHNSARINWTLTTYNGGRRIGGTSSKGSNISIPSNWNPKPGTASFSEADSDLKVISGIDYVDGKSRLLVNLTAPTLVNAPSGYSPKQVVNINGQSLSSGSTTSVINSGGKTTMSYTVTVTDSRGNKVTSGSNNITVMPLGKPIISSFMGSRSYVSSDEAEDLGAATQGVFNFKVGITKTLETIYSKMADSSDALNIDISYVKSGTSTPVESVFNKTYALSALTGGSSGQATKTLSVGGISTSVAQVMDEANVYEITLTLKDHFNEVVKTKITIDKIMDILTLGKQSAIFGNGQKSVNEDSTTGWVYPTKWGNLIGTDSTQFTKGATVKGDLVVGPSNGKTNSATSHIMIMGPDGKTYSSIRSDVNGEVEVYSNNTLNPSSYTPNSKPATGSLGVSFKTNWIKFVGASASNGYIMPATKAGKVIIAQPDNYTAKAAIQASAFQTSSTKDKKIMIQDYDDNASLLVQNLQFKTYKRILADKIQATDDVSNKPEVGLIAEQAPDILLDEEGDAVDLYTYASVLGKALQEQIDRNNKLEKRIEELEKGLS